MESVESPMTHHFALAGRRRLEFSLMRLYLSKPSNRRGAAMEPKGIREIPVTVDCIEASMSGSARATGGASLERGRDYTGRWGHQSFPGAKKQVAPRIVARSPFCGNSSPARCPAAPLGSRKEPPHH